MADRQGRAQVKWLVGEAVLVEARARAKREGRELPWVVERYLASYAAGADVPLDAGSPLVARSGLQSSPGDE